MQDLIELKESINGKGLICFFDEDRIYIIFETAKNPLEVNLKKPITDNLSLKEVTKDIQKCLQIFDHFWLDRKN